MPIPVFPLVVDIREWPELRASLKLKAVKWNWPRGEPRPVLEVISAEMEAEGERKNLLQSERVNRDGWQVAASDHAF